MRSYCDVTLGHASPLGCQAIIVVVLYERRKGLGAESIEEQSASTFSRRHLAWALTSIIRHYRIRATVHTRNRTLL